MHTNIKFYRVLTAVLVLATLILSSCVRGKKSDISSDLAQHGVAISQLSQKVLNELQTVIKNNDYQEEYIKIVNDLSPETYIMTYEPDYKEKLQNVYKLRAFNNLESVYAAYKLQFDSNVSESASGLRAKIYASCVALDSINVNENIKAQSDILKKRIKNTKYKVADGIYELSNIYASFWNEESLLWFKKLIICLEESVKGIKRIPVKAFDTQKLKKMVEDPYDNEYVLANLYKLQMIKNDRNKFANLEKQIQKVGESFDLLIQMQTELMKRRKDPLKIKELNNKLDMLVNTSLN